MGRTCAWLMNGNVLEAAVQQKHQSCAEEFDQAANLDYERSPFSHGQESNDALCVKFALHTNFSNKFRYVQALGLKKWSTQFQFRFSPTIRRQLAYIIRYQKVNAFVISLGKNVPDEFIADGNITDIKGEPCASRKIGFSILFYIMTDKLHGVSSPLCPLILRGSTSSTGSERLDSSSSLKSIGLVFAVEKRIPEN